MIAAQDLIELVRTYNPRTDEKLITAAFDFGREMHEGQFRHVPVLDNDVLIGMVSSRDAMGPELEQFMYAKILEEQTRDVLA